MTTSYAADTPERDPKKDRFQRAAFARAIAGGIIAFTDPSSIAIGIYGEWGDGKSTVLSFLEQELRRRKGIITLNFNKPYVGAVDLLVYRALTDCASQEILARAARQVIAGDARGQDGEIASYFMYLWELEAEKAKSIAGT
ncbi:MAG TPA: P-loop NTPase fold protein [Polyangia bacterium]|jgi:predicted KAP-like P-loop ATPase|nr:P-loop NTPase fold protein [Polyangia bacterium]